MEIVSGRTGKPHVTSQQFRQLIEGTVGQESCILTSGENLEPELASNNSLKIRSGMLAHHGNISSVKIGTYDAVNLDNGSQGMKRIDLVVCRYTRNAETEVENCNWVVIAGTPVSSNPVAPTYTVGNLQEGDLVDDCPVFEVHYDGINVTEVKKILSVAPNLTELNSKSIIPQSGIDWIVERHGNYFEAYGVYSGYVSANKLYAIDVQLPFVVDELIVAFANPSYHAYYLNKWYINEVQTYSKSKLNLCFQTVNISSQTDFKFDLFIAGSYNFVQA